GPGSHPPAAVPGSHARRLPGREEQDDHRQRAPAAPAAVEPRREGGGRPMNRRITAVITGMVLVLIVPLCEAVLYTVNGRERPALLQFGQPVASQTQPGLYFKLPVIQEVMRLPKTYQVWHGTSQDEKLVDVPTADGKKVEVTVWAVWKITDPVQFVRTLRTVPNAESRVKEFVRSTARDTITTLNLAEIVRSTNRKMTYTLGLPPETVARAGAPGKAPTDAGPDQAMLDFIAPPETT